jgi:hypothetical protein
LPEKLAVSGVISTVMLSWWEGRFMGQSIQVAGRVMMLP